MKKMLGESIVEKMDKIIKEGTSRLNENELGTVTVDKDVAVGLMTKFIKDKMTRSYMEKALSSIGFFEKYNLEGGYDLNSIKDAFNSMEEQEIRRILNMMSK